jgi:4-alpha-glucanotransferase
MRQAGLLMSIQSMPNQFGIGDFGPKSYDFVDLLKKTGMTIWQILPLNPLGYGTVHISHIHQRQWMNVIFHWIF